MFYCQAAHLDFYPKTVTSNRTQRTPLSCIISMSQETPLTQDYSEEDSSHATARHDTSNGAAESPSGGGSRKRKHPSSLELDDDPPPNKQLPTSSVSNLHVNVHLEDAWVWKVGCSSPHARTHTPTLGYLYFPLVSRI